MPVVYCWVKNRCTSIYSILSISLYITHTAMTYINSEILALFSPPALACLESSFRSLRRLPFWFAPHTLESVVLLQFSLNDGDGGADGVVQVGLDAGYASRQIALHVYVPFVYMALRVNVPFVYVPPSVCPLHICALPYVSPLCVFLRMIVRSRVYLFHMYVPLYGCPRGCPYVCS